MLRRLRLKAHFYKESDDDVTQNDNGQEYELDPFDALKPRRSSWNPPEGKHPSLDVFITKCRTDIGNILKSDTSASANVTPQDRHTIKQLRNNKEYVIKSADKGGAIVVWRRDLYVQEAMRQLSNDEFYSRLETDPTPDQQDNISRTVKELIHAGALPSNAANLIQDNPQCATFYLLPKIHKVDNPGRPIVSTINCPTELISQYLDSIISPLVTKLPTYVKDSSDAIRLFKDFNFQGDEPHRLLFSMDVSSLYTNIPTDDGLKAIKHFLQRYPSRDRPSDATLLRLAELVLTLSSFNFDGECYSQKKGVAMGTKMGPAYACLFVGHIEEQMLHNYQHPKPVLLKRYIDDYVGVFTSTRDELERFIQYVNSYHRSLRFTHDISDESITFLDVTVSVEGDTLAD